MVFLWFCQSLYHIIGRANTYFLMPLLSTVITLKTQKYAVKKQSWENMARIQPWEVSDAFWERVSRKSSAITIDIIALTRQIKKIAW
jgi:hypothetical protein